ncbi:Histone-lysine N-methyltransferase, H3 lysine-9 specific [Psilocybe cubensis]|uniref:Histone-lysine N-methyltransferase, H3 lysine-9 specific n=1 Tax=Psilocybe cubensis TaxID=181762 RepID=A0ACB8GJY6_PSICU|nr:Histone-lysine N-methyltransferase, H3 lysine-9 specific [Psilocybe cubensis]KAH9476035.1 Histone-lysine N-methyltransferase, H3 lysine-9 specific [Psilocybe cubensis]
MSASAPGSSRFPNAASTSSNSLSVGPRTVSSMLPPSIPTKSSSTNHKPKYPFSQPNSVLNVSNQSVKSSGPLSQNPMNAVASSSTLDFKKKDFPSSLDSKLFERARQSPRKSESILGRSVSAREPTKGKGAPTFRPRSATGDFIDLSGPNSSQLSAKDPNTVVDMSDDDDPPPKRMVARKSAGGKMARKPPTTDNMEPEVIEISSDTDEELPPKVRPPIQSSNSQPSTLRNSNHTSTVDILSKVQKTSPSSRRSSGSDKINVGSAFLNPSKPQQSGSTADRAEEKALNQVPPQNMDVDPTQPSLLASHPVNFVSSQTKSSIPPKHRRGVSGLEIRDTVTKARQSSQEDMQVDDDKDPSQIMSSTPRQALISPAGSGITGLNRSRGDTVSQPSLPPASTHTPRLSDTLKRNNSITSTQNSLALSPDVEHDKPIPPSSSFSGSSIVQNSINISNLSISSSNTKSVGKPVPTLQNSSAGPSTTLAHPTAHQTISSVKKPDTSSSTKSIPEPSSSQQTTKKDLETSSASKPLRFGRPQVAVKSAGGNRMKQRRRYSSSPPSDSSEDSSSNSDEDSSSPNELSPRRSSKGEQAINKLSSHVPAKKATRTPDRSISVKKQPITPKLFKSPNSTPAQSPTKNKYTPGQRAPASLSLQAGIASGSKPFPSSFRHRGDTIESAIDLTSDIENDDLLLEPIKVASEKLVGQLSKWKGKGRAVSPPDEPLKPYIQTPRSGTDELLLKPSEEEPSPPPGSSSPPLLSPATPAAEFSEGFDGSGRQKADKRRNSAPAVPDVDNRPASSNVPAIEVSNLTDIRAKAASPGRAYTKPLSAGSKPPPSIQSVVSRADQITNAQASNMTVQGALTTNRPSSNFEPTFLTSTTGTRAKSSPVVPRISSVSSSKSKPQLVESKVIPSSIESSPAKESAEESAPNDDDELSGMSSDIEMRGAQTSEDEAMQESEVHDALMEDDAPLDTFSEQETGEASASEETENSTEADLSAAPLSLARTIRQMSRRSSHSSGPADSDLAERDVTPVSRDTTPDDVVPLPLVPTVNKTLGGFPAITWNEYRQDLNNFIPKCLRSEDLPHSLQDQINFMSEYMQKMPALRDVFEAMILENTIENEPEAPPIRVINDLDDEPTPPWEFHYTNEMWHGKDVPAPDMKSLISCTCKGGCSPKSKTCACLIRQRKESDDPNISEFAYDKHGRLRTPEYPIFECNDLCGCGDECRNRVVQHGRKVQVNIKKTKHKGWGIFAGNKRIPSGTFIGIYSGELLLDAEAHERGTYYNKSGKTYLFDLDFYHLKKDYVSVDGKEWTNKYTIDAYQAGNNHSCDPNCSLQACYINEGNLDKPLLVFFTHKDIEAHEEICFDYSGGFEEDIVEQDEEADEAKSDDKIYAKCMCGASNCKGTMFKR